MLSSRDIGSGRQELVTEATERLALRRYKQRLAVGFRRGFFLLGLICAAHSTVKNYRSPADSRGAAKIRVGPFLGVKIQF